MTVREAAAKWKMSPANVKRLCRNGVVKFEKVECPQVMCGWYYRILQPDPPERRKPGAKGLEK